MEEFVGNPNHGHVALIDLIKDLADHPTSTPRKNTKKYAVLDREPVSLKFTKLCLIFNQCVFRTSFTIACCVSKLSQHTGQVFLDVYVTTHVINTFLC